MITRFFPSNPDPNDENSIYGYSNMNRLGMNFLTKFKGYKYYEDIDFYTARLELLK
jgi:hypothetical protein